MKRYVMKCFSYLFHFFYWCVLMAFFLFPFPCPLHTSVLSLSPSFSILPVCPYRPGSERSQHRDHSAAGGGVVWAGGLLVSVCGLELRRDHQEPQSPRPHCLWVYSTGSSSLALSFHSSFLSKQNLLAAKSMRFTGCLVYHDRFIDSGYRGSEIKDLLTWDLSVPLNFSW